MTAFVAGATGYTGQQVVRWCCAQNLRTIAHVRVDSPRQAEWRDRFRSLGAEVSHTAWDLEAMTETLKDAAPTIVFALLGTTNRRRRAAARAGGPAETYQTIDYDLTMVLLEAAQRCDSQPCFVYLSSMGVTPTSRNGYLQVRARIEDQLRQGPLPYVIARPAFITGADREERRLAERLAAWAGDGALALAGALGQREMAARYSSLSATELGKALVSLALDPAARDTVQEADALRANGQ